MEGVTNNEGVFVMATTNTPYDIDPALLRRFDKLIYVPLPNKSTRYHMFQKQLLHEKISTESLEELPSKTEGFSGSDIDKLCKAALMEPINKLQDAKYFRKSHTNSNVEMVYTPCEKNEE